MSASQTAVSSPRLKNPPSASQRRLALLTGGAGLVAFALAWIEGPNNLQGASGATVRRYFEGNFSTLQRDVWAETLVFAAVLIFVLGISSLMRQAEAPKGLYRDLTVLSGGLVAAAYWLQGSVDAVPLVLADDAGKLSSYSDQALVALEVLARVSETSGDLATVPRALLVLAVSLLALRTGFVPRWTAVIGLAVVALSLVGVLGSWPIPALGGALVIALFGFYLWLLLVSAALVLRGLRRVS